MNWRPPPHSQTEDLKNLTVLDHDPERIEKILDNLHPQDSPQGDVQPKLTKPEWAEKSQAVLI